MSFSVITYNSEDELAEAIQAVVSTHRSEDKLDDALEAATATYAVLVKGNGAQYVLVDNPQITNVSLRILAKGSKFTVILETA